MTMARGWLLILLLAATTACTLNTGPQQVTEAITPEVTPEDVSLLVSPPAQTCDQAISVALETVGGACDDLNVNAACYGNRLVDAEFRSGQASTFEAAGDIVRLASLQSLRTAALDAQTQQWGIAVVKAQASLENTLPGQNVTFLLFGDTEMRNPSPEMNAVTVRTGIGPVSCEDSPPSAVLIQSPDDVEVAMTINGAEITLGSTSVITAVQNEEMTVAILEGEAVVSAQGVQQTVTPGTQVRLPLGDEDGLAVTGPPSAPEPFEADVVVALPVDLLERTVTVPGPAQATDPNATTTPTLAPLRPTPGQLNPNTAPQLGCTPDDNWSGRYTIQRGDTLTRIAQRFGVTLTELQQANCIANADLITGGTVLRVPLPPATNTPTTEPATPTATGPNLRADDTSIEAGSCTTIRWDVANIQQVFFEGQPTTGSNSREVCPETTQTYTLLVVLPDESQERYTVTINVEATGPVCGNAVCEDGEDARSCFADCTPVCGDEVCSEGEDARTCPADCDQQIQSLQGS